MAQVIPINVRKVWKEWKIPTMVFLSLALQSILILMAKRRKYSTRRWLRLFPWLAYFLAETVALISLSLISNFREADSTNHTYIIKAFWAPLLLIHLGGPDTITAYSLEDNETWHRSLILLLGQAAIALYIFFNSWSGNELNFLSIPMLLAGAVKFGERIMALRCASSEHFRKAMFPTPDPGPNYARYMDDYRSKRTEGYRVSSKRINEEPKIGHRLGTVARNSFISGAASLQDACSFFKKFKRLFADLILSIHDIDSSKSFFQNRPCEEAFRVIEIELGFTYDVFYTKVVLVHSLTGVFRRVFTFSCTVSVLTLFCFIKKEDYLRKDVVTSYVLLAGAVAHEIYSICLQLHSDWTMLCVSRHKHGPMQLLYRAISLIAPSEKQRWSNKIALYNLISLSLRDKPGKYFSFIQKIIAVYRDWTDQYFYESVRIPKELKELIFQRLLEKSRNPAPKKELCAHRGDWVLKEHQCFDQLGWSVSGEFAQSVLLWHIATILCYHVDSEETPNDPEANIGNSNSNSVNCLNPKEMSKLLSEYMLYILVLRPFMLPNGIGQIRFQDTRAEADEFFKERKSTAGTEKNACSALLKVNTDIPPSEVKGDRSKSVLFDACILAKALQALETKGNWDNEHKWVLISHVWVEMLSYAATQCQRNQHVQQLRRGGELLTHVWLLMAHLGITEQFQISDGHARTKLVVQ